jgi:hypothetical protein
VNIPEPHNLYFSPSVTTRALSPLSYRVTQKAERTAKSSRLLLLLSPETGIPRLKSGLHRMPVYLVWFTRKCSIIQN